MGIGIGKSERRGVAVVSILVIKSVKLFGYAVRCAEKLCFSDRGIAIDCRGYAADFGQYLRRVYPNGHRAAAQPRNNLSRFGEVELRRTSMGKAQENRFDAASIAGGKCLVICASCR